MTAWARTNRNATTGGSRSNDSADLVSNRNAATTGSVGGRGLTL
jgi:hypothetical protein